MQANTDAQARLHPQLVSDDARRIIEVARRYEAAGWKVNGAGGDGGSIAILRAAAPAEATAFLADLAVAVPSSRPIPIRLSADGLRVFDSDGLKARQHRS